MERIVCAAIHYDDGGTTYVHQPVNIKSGYVVCGLRHCNCITIHAMLKGLKKPQDPPNRHVEGFLTSANRFVNRKEAGEIAMREGQVKGGEMIMGNRLDSSDLY